MSSYFVPIYSHNFAVRNSFIFQSKVVHDESGILFAYDCIVGLQT